ncbi:MAG: type III-A CRISPR-associated protein Csm2 [Lachnospiraceae bacterium]|nr:type III-A CRISPR-associated protein Csm2 [Lachnospiraceae bacterium]
MRISENSYVKKAEETINELLDIKNKNGKPVPIATTSQMRNILAMSADIYNRVMVNSGEDLSDEIIGLIEYLKIRIVYEAGRDEKVKKLIVQSEMLEIIDEINGSKKNFILFNHYLEALIAYRKFKGGKETQ